MHMYSEHNTHNAAILTREQARALPMITALCVRASNTRKRTTHRKPAAMHEGHASSVISRTLEGIAYCTIALQPKGVRSIKRTARNVRTQYAARTALAAPLNYKQRAVSLLTTHVDAY